MWQSSSSCTPPTSYPLPPPPIHPLPIHQARLPSFQIWQCGSYCLFMSVAIIPVSADRFSGTWRLSLLDPFVVADARTVRLRMRRCVRLLWANRSNLLTRRTRRLALHSFRDKTSWKIEQLTADFNACAVDMQMQISQSGIINFFNRISTTNRAFTRDWFSYVYTLDGFWRKRHVFPHSHVNQNLKFSSAENRSVSTVQKHR